MTWLQPTPPDERIVAPPPGLEWSERIRTNGGSATFDGPRPKTHFGVWLVLAVGCAVFLGSNLFSHPRPSARLPAAVIGLVVVIVALAWKWRMSAVSAALVDVDGARMRVDPVGFLARVREVPLGNVDYVAAETEIETRDTRTYEGEGRYVEWYRWYTVHAHLRSGERIMLAAFNGREHALFVAQRLDALVERAQAVVGMVREPRAVQPVPYR